MREIQKIHLSDEQMEFLSQALNGRNILVDACIGSGKTTAIQYLCDKLAKSKRVLYLTYNRLLKIDAQAKIKSKNATVQNYHGIAGHYLYKNGISASVGDLITRFNVEKPEIEHYDVLIIDEYQDIETEHTLLLEHIKTSNPQMQIIAVGDMQQKIYDKTTLDVPDFINRFLGEHLKLEFTKCFRLSPALAEKLGRIWHKTITGVNSECVVEEMNMEQVVGFLSTQKPQDILCLGSRSGDLSKTLNMLENEYPAVYNKQTVFASISENDSLGTAKPTPDTAIFTTFDSSKGLERKICVVFDYTESYWQVRITQPQQSYEILRNIFCVAASRGKSKIIFVNSGEEMLSEATISTKVDENQKLIDVDIAAMFDFKYRENINACYKLLQIKPLPSENHEEIEVKRADCMIDLSPCVGIFQEAMFFNSYEIDKSIELFFSLHNNKTYLKSLWTKEIKQASLEKKILFFVSLETNQDRYLTQVELPFVNEAAKKDIAKRLLTRLQHNENAQVECNIPFSDRKNGTLLFSARGFADVVKNGVVYELKFVSELSHEHYLQCACYMVALKLEKGVLWNTRDNTAYEIKISDRQKFLDAVANTITKNRITAYYLPSVRTPRPLIRQTEQPSRRGSVIPPEVLSKYVAGVHVEHTSFGSGVILERRSLNSSHMIKVEFEESGIRNLLLEAVLDQRILRINPDRSRIKSQAQEPSKNPQQERYETGYNDVKDAFIQQTSIIRDRFGTRWVKCEKCGAIKQDVEYVSYGGREHINLGLCRDCYKKAM